MLELLFFLTGVADGVGGWRAYGVDPGRFSRAVMRHCERLVLSGRSDLRKPCFLIAQSYEDVLTSKDSILGSATFCIICLQRDERRIYTASLGDCGFLVVRGGRVIQRSTHQKHAFNTPFQLASPPPIHSIHFHHDLPAQATQSSIDVEPGDLLVVGTDGLFDNLTETMILEEVCTIRLSDDGILEGLHRCARCLVDRARSAAFTPNFQSPIAKEARRYGINIVAGAPGDVTVIVGLIFLDEDRPRTAEDPCPTTGSWVRATPQISSVIRRNTHIYSNPNSLLFEAAPCNMLLRRSQSVPRF
ncbi:unnamed protein product [Dicrocoelium dendriticum]|nr:unnamed protein product [Dicrocoelium dendriticum]